MQKTKRRPNSLYLLILNQTTKQLISTYTKPNDQNSLYLLILNQTTTKKISVIFFFKYVLIGQFCAYYQIVREEEFLE